MTTSKVALFLGIGATSEFMLAHAPSELEVTLIDPTLSEDEQVRLCSDADVIISSSISAAVLKQSPNIKLIQTLSAGFEQMDLGAILEMGIPVANNGGANSVAVSEHAMALMINLGKKIMLQWESTTKNRTWRGDLYVENLTELTGKTVGIVGLGRIGKQVAKRLTGFDTRTIYHDIVEVGSDVRQALKAELVAFDDLLRESDIVSLHVPLTSRTRGMMSDREFGMMKPTAYLINTCRGRVVDEAALCRALKDGEIAAAGLDVLQEEPTPTDNPLLDMDNVLITPHMATSSQESRLQTTVFAWDNIMRVLSGETAESLATPQ